MIDCRVRQTESWAASQDASQCAARLPNARHAPRRTRQTKQPATVGHRCSTGLVPENLPRWQKLSEMPAPTWPPATSSRLTLKGYHTSKVTPSSSKTWAGTWWWHTRHAPTSEGGRWGQDQSGAGGRGRESQVTARGRGGGRPGAGGAAEVREARGGSRLAAAGRREQAEARRWLAGAGELEGGATPECPIILPVLEPSNTWPKGVLDWCSK